MTTITNLNDTFRKAGPGPDWIITCGVAALGQFDVHWACETVVDYDEFRESADPHGEHDFGTFMIDQHRLFWKIDYYDLRLDMGSPDPSDPTVTRRVLTIMLASEY